MNQVLKMGVILMVVGLVAAVGLGFTYTVTRDRIESYDRQVEAKAAVSALPGVKSSNELEVDKELQAQVKQVDGVEKVYSTDSGYIFIIETKGYGGPLILAIGVDLQGEVQGIAVISSKETVGVGSTVFEDDGVKRWLGKTSEDALEVGEDIQAVTGATITSKAVNEQVKKALEAYKIIR